MSATDQRMSSTGSISPASLRRFVYAVTLLTLLLPPFVGGSLMGLIGIYPMPEFYFVFTSYSAAYITVCVASGLAFAKYASAYLVRLASQAQAVRERTVARIFRPFPVYLFLLITLYSIGGATSANISLQRMGYVEYSLEDYLLTYFGLIPVVLITVFPIFFYFTDYLGRYLGPRGFHLVATPMWTKLVMLGLVTPTLIDSVLITYFVNRTGEFDVEMFGMWLTLVVLAAIGTYLALSSFRQGLEPLQDFLERQQGEMVGDTELLPQSIDELGSLTGELSQLLGERQRIGEVLNRERNFINAVVDNAGALVVVLDAQGRITRFNRACEELTGYDYGQVKGRYVWDLFLVPADAEKVRREAFAALAENPQGGVGRYTNQWIVKDGALRTIEWTNTLLLDEHGRMEHLVSIGIDVTKRMEAMEALQRSEAQLKELNETLETRVAERTRALQTSNKELEAYSYSIAHDLRAPLRAISGFSQIVLMDTEDKLDEEDVSHLQRVVAATKHMAQLIDDILALGRVTRQELGNQQLDLSAIAQEVVKQLQHMEPQRQVEVTIEAGLVDRGDPQLARLLLMNLLGNAWKYTRDEARPLIEFRRMPGQTGAIYMVRDNGVGFDMAHAKHLFRPFHRLHAPEDFEGTGVGLATAQRIVERHGGRIWADAKRGKGASFYFTLAATPPPLAADDAGPDQRR